ncbi:hypothetical protein HY798_04190 [Candidatus Falkowbacteria bacterium]|nr:hypothetical protein [Candidatus Falkowbacteria bacterium]
MKNVIKDGANLVNPDKTKMDLNKIPNPKLERRCCSHSRTLKASVDSFGGK